MVLVAQSCVDGTVNAFLTLRVGCLASNYCSSVTKPSTRFRRRTATVQAAGMLGAVAKDGAERVGVAMWDAVKRTSTGAASGLASGSYNIRAGFCSGETSYGRVGSARGDAIPGSNRGRWCGDDFQRDQSDSSFEAVVAVKHFRNGTLGASPRPPRPLSSSNFLPCRCAHRAFLFRCRSIR